MSDTHTEVTSKSWGQRLKESLKGIITGVIALAIGVSLLFWNEGRTVKNHKALKEGRAQVQSIQPNGDIDAFHDKLVHFSGTTTTNDTLRDSEFKIAISGLEFTRTVEMFQWVERQEKKTEKKLGGSEETITNYIYEKKWLNKLENSDDFNNPNEYKNPKSIAYQDFKQISQNAKIDKIKITETAIQLLGCSEGVDLKPETMDSSLQIRGNKVFLGKGNWEDPQVGDLRISYEEIKNQDVSIVSALHNGATTEYITSNDRGIFLASCGIHNSQAMFATAIESNKTMGWVWRGVGTMLLFIGFSLIFKILSVIADVVPFIGNIVGYGTSFISGVLAFVIALIVIAIAWIFYRPILAICLLLAAGGLVALLIFRKRKKKVENI